MKEEIEEYIYDDEFEPIEMVYYSDKFTEEDPLWQIQLEIHFDEDFDDIIAEYELENSGYTLESITIKYLESINPDLLDKIVSFTDVESSTLVLYTDSEESLRNIAQTLQKFFTDIEVFEKIIEDNLDFIQERYS